MLAWYALPFVEQPWLQVGDVPGLCPDFTGIARALPGIAGALPEH